MANKQADQVFPSVIITLNWATMTFTKLKNTMSNEWERGYALFQMRCKSKILDISKFNPFRLCGYNSVPDYRHLKLGTHI